MPYHRIKSKCVRSNKSPHGWVRRTTKAAFGNSFSEQLRLRIAQSDLSQYQIAKRAEIDQALLSRFVNRAGGLSIESIDRIYEVLELRLV